MKVSDPIRRCTWLVIFLFGIFVFDWVTPHDLSLGPLYLLVVGYACWQLGLRAGIVTAIVAPLLWACADYGDGHRYPHIWLLLENAGVRCITYLLTVGAVSLYRKTLEAHRRRLAMLERLLLVCPGCGAIGVNEGGWRKASEFQEGLAERYTLCPTCAASHQSNVSSDPARPSNG